MKKPEKTLKGQAKRFALFESKRDTYAFLIPMFGTWVVSGWFAGAEKWYALVIGTILSISFFLYSRKVISGIGSLYHSGSNEKDHRAVLKGMYNLANGQRGAGKFEMAERSFQQILVDYPDELDAMYYLAKLYDLKFDNPEKALGEYRRLKRKIEELKVDYKYEEALNERINELKDYLGQND